MQARSPARPSLRAWAARLVRYVWLGAIVLLAAALWWGPAAVATFLTHTALVFATLGFVLTLLATRANLRSHGLSLSYHDTIQSRDDLADRDIAARTNRLAIAAWLLAGFAFVLGLLLRAVA